MVEQTMASVELHHSLVEILVGLSLSEDEELKTVKMVRQFVPEASKLDFVVTQGIVKGAVRLLKGFCEVVRVDGSMYRPQDGFLRVGRLV